MDQSTLENWLDAKATLDAAKKSEMELRKQICDELLADKPEGTNNFNLFGYDIKAVKKFTYSLDPDFDDTMLTDDEKECIRFKPSLVLGRYKKLIEPGALDDYVTVTEATPTLSISLNEE